ncbi:MAG TPA: methyltransferase domain-containing protein [Chitinophagaceae bacterium]|nr:methyltransferase domain-containing protein [Chitinophagaceae bacterium]
MLITEALEFLSGVELNAREPSIWADLGCGDGFFTYVLAGMLPSGSKIYALDKQFQSLKKPADNNIQVVFQKADFITDDLQLPPLNGVLLANSLHYVSDKNSFVEKISGFLKADGMFIIIEYDTSRANPWIPFPVDFKNLSKLFADRGYNNIQKIGERKSIYSQAKLYACTIRH